MRYIILTALLALIFGCTSDNSNSNNEQPVATVSNKAAAEKTIVVEKTSAKTTIVGDFLNDVTSLEDTDSKQPITAFQEAAASSADKTMSLSKSNVKDVLAEAANYKYFVILIGDHTIVKVENVADCKQSGSWGACMPLGTGYIKKGKLIFQDDYINNIIGRPDSQERTVYLFK